MSQSLKHKLVFRGLSSLLLWFPVIPRPQRAAPLHLQSNRWIRWSDQNARKDAQRRYRNCANFFYKNTLL